MADGLVVDATEMVESGEGDGPPSDLQHGTSPRYPMNTLAWCMKTMDQTVCDLTLLSTFPVQLPFVTQLLNAKRLALQERIQRCVRQMPDGYSYMYSKRPVRLWRKLFAPVRQFPGYNFAGRLYGPQGSTIQRLQRETGCRITILHGKDAECEEDKEQALATGENRPDTSKTAARENLAVVIDVHGAEWQAREKMQRAVDRLTRLLTPPPPGKDSLKRMQLRQLAMIRGTYTDRRSGRQNRETAS